MTRNLQHHQTDESFDDFDTINSTTSAVYSDSDADSSNAYSDFEARFDPMSSDRQARRKRKAKAKHQSKKSGDAILHEIADTDVVESGFETTYKPSKYESGWLLGSLRPFFDQKFASDVQALVKGGKEASVYRLEAHPTTGDDFYAAKVYRPRMFRSLSNDTMYREGRDTLNGEGRSVKKTDHRIMRAMHKKTVFGLQVAHTSWLMYEFTTLQQLYDAGIPVPKPLSAGENAILMEYIGDENMPAPTLSEVELDADEAKTLFYEVLRTIETMLQMGFIHGDLSAYNILYWDGDVVLIDFPQVTMSGVNSQAHMILSRDVERVCQYFASQGVDCDAESITSMLWKRYVAQDEQIVLADQSRWYGKNDDDDRYDDRYDD